MLTPEYGSTNTEPDPSRGSRADPDTRIELCLINMLITVTTHPSSLLHAVDGVLLVAVCRQKVCWRSIKRPILLVSLARFPSCTLDSAAIRFPVVAIQILQAATSRGVDVRPNLFVFRHARTIRVKDVILQGALEKIRDVLISAQ